VSRHTGCSQNVSSGSGSYIFKAGLKVAGLGRTEDVVGLVII